MCDYRMSVSIAKQKTCGQGFAFSKCASRQHSRAEDND